MNHHQQDFSSFDEYLRQGEPTQQEAASNWKTAIGLQAVGKRLRIYTIVL